MTHQGPLIPTTACKVCGHVFIQYRSTQQVCSVKCAGKLVRLRKEFDRAETKRRREAIKPRSQWLREAQAAFNAWIRVRDSGLPCISCGRTDRNAWDAGHYLTTGARPELRFHEVNVWRQCVPCNQHLHGNLVLYRAELVRRIGLEAVEELEGPHPPAKWSVDELKAIRDDYRARARAEGG